MPKRVLDVGNCLFDHGNIREMICRHFDACVERSSGPEEAITKLRQNRYDLVLVNRKMHDGSGDGIDLIRQMKADPQLNATPVMLLSNYQQYQQEAIEAGAEPGFGKAELDSPATREKLARWLE